MDITNLFTLPHELAATDAELVTPLLETGQFRLERIVSTGQASPPDFWYDQHEHEWLVVLTGAARLEFRTPAEHVELHPGDTLHIPAHRPHRVNWTDPTRPTIWLALFYLTPVPPAAKSPPAQASPP